MTLVPVDSLSQLFAAHRGGYKWHVYAKTPNTVHALTAYGDLMKAAGVDVKPSSVQIATILKDIVGRAEQVRQFDAGERLEGNIVEFIYTHLDTLEREHAPRDAWGRILADASQRFGLAEDAISGVLRKWGIARRVAPMPKHRVPLISDEERAFLLRGPKVAQATRFKTTSSIASPPMKTCAGRSHGELEK